MVATLSPTGLTALEGYWDAGNNSEHINIDWTSGSKPLIRDAFDQSGNQRRLRNHKVAYPPAYRRGLTIDASKGGPWTTERAFIGADFWGDSSGNASPAFANVLYLDDRKKIVLPGAFTIFDVVIQGRDGGSRDLWSGKDGSSIRWDQARPNTNLNLLISGVSRRVSATVPIGPQVLELSRSASGVIKVVSGGVDITAAGLPPMPGTLEIDCMGWNRINDGSQYDDYRMEAAICSEDITEAERAVVRLFWGARWTLA